MIKNIMCTRGKIKTLILLVIFAASGLLSHTVIAAQDIWEEKTPSGFSGTMNTVASFGDYVYVGTTEGVYKSTDRGDNWTQINTGLTNLNVTSIAIGWIYDFDNSIYVADAS